MVGEGIPRQRDGRQWWYTHASEVWYYRRKLDRLQEQAPSLEKEKARKLAIEIKIAEIDLAKAQGDAISVDDAVAQLENVLERLRAPIKNLPARAPRFTKLKTMEARKRLEELADDLLGQLQLVADALDHVA